MMYATCEIIVAELLSEQNPHQETTFASNLQRIFTCGMSVEKCEYAIECRQFIIDKYQLKEID